MKRIVLVVAVVVGCKGKASESPHALAWGDWIPMIGCTTDCD